MNNRIMNFAKKCYFYTKKDKQLVAAEPNDQIFKFSFRSYVIKDQKTVCRHNVYSVVFILNTFINKCILYLLN